MHVAGVGSIPNVASAARSAEAVEGPGPDLDGDADDQGAPAVKAAPAPGVGQLIDMSA